MWQVLHNIRSVAHYESKLLLRTWFFKIFGLGSLVYIFVQNFTMLTDVGKATWLFRSVPASIPYVMLLQLNIIQAVIAVFLSSEFLKRDKQLDTSEVFYVRPLGNAEYVLGKTWGNLRVFLALDVLALLLVVVFNVTAGQTYIDWSAYLIYFLIICIPTLIFIMGLSFFTMLLLKNQALTFIVLLGYIAYTILYAGTKYDCIFDFMAYRLPMFRSTVVGFADADLILRLRLLYLLTGLGFICLTVVLFLRLPASYKERPTWSVVAAACLVLAGGMAVHHLRLVSERIEVRKEMIAENDLYGDRSVLMVHEYTIDLEQKPQTFDVKAHLLVSPQTVDSSFVFCLNPGLKVSSVACAGQELTFERRHQLLLVDFGRALALEDTLEMDIRYGGALDPDACFLDAADRNYYSNRTMRNITIPKRYLFQSSSYSLFTPESYWYPRPGTSFTQMHTRWQQSYFSYFDLNVKPLNGLRPVSQGALVDTTDGWFSYMPEVKLPSITLAIGDYDYVSVDTSGVTFGVYYLKGHDFFRNSIDSAKHLIPEILADQLDNFERANQLPYRYFRFSILEVPAPFSSYRRSWTTASENTQPEMVLMPEMGFGVNNADFVSDIRARKRNGRGRQTLADYERQTMTVFFNMFSNGYNQTYSQYPQLFDFVYNVYSPTIPLANRMIAIYFDLRKNNNNTGRSNDNGNMTVEERASLLLQEQSLAEIVADTSRSNMINSVIQLKAEQLFAYGEAEIGRDSFYQHLSNIVKAYPFQNQLLDDVFVQLEDSTGVNMQDRADKWFHAKGAPRYLFTTPAIRRILDEGMGYYEVKQTITNDSDEEGLIMLVMQYGREDNDYFPLVMAPHTSKEAVFVSELRPQSLVTRTMLSQNLPSRIQTALNTMDWGRWVRGEAGETHITDVPRPSSYTSLDEIIVDNEDTLLFSYSQQGEMGRLQRWLNREQQSEFKYGSFSAFRPPVDWRAIANNAFYGQFVRSGYVIRSTGFGGARKTAQWKVYVDEPGTYEVFSNIMRNDNAFQQQGRQRQGSYRYHIFQDGRVDVPVNLFYGRTQSGWNSLGTFVFNRDTVLVTLSNESELRYVTADAIKFVKK